MRLGQAAMEALQAEICGLLTPGNELVVAGAVALEGTVQIAKIKHDILREHFSESFLRNAGELRAVYGTVAIMRMVVPLRTFPSTIRQKTMAPL